MQGEVTDTQSKEVKSTDAQSKVSDTGLCTNFWKHHGKGVPSENPYVNEPGKREKPLYKNQFMSLFINEEVIETVRQMEPDPGMDVQGRKNTSMLLTDPLRHKYILQTLKDVVGVKKKALIPKENRVTQVVILGSGYDTTPVRKKAYPVKFFELDRAEVFKRKQRIYDDNNIEPNAIYIPLDYVKNNFIDALKEQGLDVTQPTYIIWEGNTMYLDKPSVIQVLNRIKEAFLTVYITFDYFSESLVNKRSGIPSADDITDKFSQAKAQFTNGYDDISILAEECGFRMIDNQTMAVFGKTLQVEENPHPLSENYSLCTLTLE